jgi:hypothetical protein
VKTTFSTSRLSHDTIDEARDWRHKTRTRIVARDGSVDEGDFPIHEHPIPLPYPDRVFVLLLGVSSATFATSVNLFASPWSNLTPLVANLSVALLTIYFMGAVVKRLAVNRSAQGIGH